MDVANYGVADLFSVVALIVTIAWISGSLIFWWALVWM